MNRLPAVAFWLAVGYAAPKLADTALTYWIVKQGQPRRDPVMDPLTGNMTEGYRISFDWDSDASTS